MARQPKFSRVDDTTFRNAGGGGATVALSASRMGTRNSGGKPTSSRLATSAERLLAACKHSISPAGSLRRNEQDVEVDNETAAGREETAAGGRIEDARLHRLGERRATAFVCGIFRKMHTSRVIVRAVREVCAFLFSWTWFKVEVLKCEVRHVYRIIPARYLLVVAHLLLAFKNLGVQNSLWGWGNSPLNYSFRYSLGSRSLK